MRPFLRLENEQKSCAILVYSFLEIALSVLLNLLLALIGGVIGRFSHLSRQIPSRPGIATIAILLKTFIVPGWRIDPVIFCYYW